jgi:hypothetical protein
VRRLDTLQQPGIGVGWAVQFRFRGKDRKLNARIVAYQPPDGYTIEMESANLFGTLRVELVALSRSHTRINVHIALEARSLPARLLLQSLKLARGNMVRRLESRLADFAADVEARHARHTGASKG